MFRVEITAMIVLIQGLDRNHERDPLLRAISVVYADHAIFGGFDTSLCHKSIAYHAEMCSGLLKGNKNNT